MSDVESVRTTKNITAKIRNGDTRKQAGSNRLQITIHSSDWKVGDQSVNMTIRDAQALRSFLNEELD